MVGVEQSYATREDNVDVSFFFRVVMLEEILDYRNITKALQQVTSNKGAGGVDGMETVELRDWLETNWIKLKQSILDGTYQPSPVRKVSIPKPSGGTRTLGIPMLLSYYFVTVLIRNVFILTNIHKINYYGLIGKI